MSNIKVDIPTSELSALLRVEQALFEVLHNLNQRNESTPTREELDLLQASLDSVQASRCPPQAPVVRQRPQMRLVPKE